MIQLKEVTLVSRTQPSGPLCLWQCLQTPPLFHPDVSITLYMPQNKPSKGNRLIHEAVLIMICAHQLLQHLLDMFCFSGLSLYIPQRVMQTSSFSMKTKATFSVANCSYIDNVSHEMFKDQCSRQRHIIGERFVKRNITDVLKIPIITDFSLPGTLQFCCQEV